MINRLCIINIALIERAEIEFCPTLNVLSGETGAGKSVILDSINFVLGAKADKSMIRYGENECVVTAEFDVRENMAVQNELREMDLELDDDSLMISRKYTLDGHSSIKVNGMPVNATMLRKITSHLVDVYGQSEHFFLLKESNQLNVIDALAGDDLTALKTNLSALRTQLRERVMRLNALGVDDNERNRRMDVLSFQINEIKSAELREGEEEELLSKRAKMNALEKIMTALQEAESALNSDAAGIDALRVACKAVNGIAALDEEYQAVANRLDDLLAETEDVAGELNALGDGLYFDENEMQELERRLDDIKNLKRKYGGDIPSIIQFLERAENDYDLLVNSGREVEKLTTEIERLKREIFNVCQKMTVIRRETANTFTTDVVAQLKTLNIPSAQFDTLFNQYEYTDVDNVTANGMDEIQFLFSANAGEPVKPLSKIISGGEMSRFMLAVKTCISTVNGISTYIFDEIDAGISGKTAKVVAEKFAKIAVNTQIIAVSHLAQIVSMADRQFLIQKEEKHGKTVTDVYQLDEQSRIGELVRLLGGDDDSDYAKKHAQELINSAKIYKNILS